MGKLKRWRWAALVCCALVISASGYAREETAEKPAGREAQTVIEAGLAGGNSDIETADRQVLAGKSMRGKVYVSKYGPVNDRVVCDNYQVFLLKDAEQGAAGELILEARQADFEFVLSEEQLKAYSYLEFISSHYSKTIALRDLNDGLLEIVLEPEVMVKKPAIYLYPSQKTQVLVVHKFKGKILNTYPLYDGNWTVIAEPDGSLLNLGDNRVYRYLFWDGAYTFSSEHYQYKDGFYVESNNYVTFLQDKLAGIGLNQQEINDFIVYWLPALNKYPQCFIHFRINDNIGGSSVLETQPVADTVIRVFMEFSGCEQIGRATQLPEQVLPAFIRTGFTLVEWGGAEIGHTKLE